MFGASQVTEYSCGANANYLIAKWFGDCIYTTWDTVAFCVGLSSVFFWIIAQLPQFISNFLRSAADALSPWFLAQWLAGDTFNFLGCVLTGDQLKTQTITAGYFIFSDIIIITQYIYYLIRNRNTIDFDESVRKGSAYSDALKSNATKGSTVEKGDHLQRACKDDQIHSNSAMGLTDSRNGSSRRSGRGSESSDGMGSQQSLLLSAVSGTEQQDSWMYEHRHRLRRLAQEYGLEYGQAMAMRLTSLYNSRRKDKYNVAHSRSSRRAHETIAYFRKPRNRAVLGIAGIFGLASVTKLQCFSSVSKVGRFTLGRRSLLALHDTGAILTNKSMWMEGGQLAGVHFADQLSLFGQRAYSWTGTIGTCLGWGSSALYLGSRLSQLVKNKQRRSADGLALGMVICAILANLTYGPILLERHPGLLEALAPCFLTLVYSFKQIITIGATRRVCQMSTLLSWHDPSQIGCAAKAWDFPLVCTKPYVSFCDRDICIKLEKAY